MDTAAIKKHISEDNWYGILKAAGCTTSEVSPEIQEMTKKKDVSTLLNVAIAYGQLSNLRVIKKKVPGKKREFNVQEANDCFQHAITLYRQILSIDEKNVMGLQSMAYVFYKYIIAYFGVNKKEIEQMDNVSILDCFKNMTETYDTLFNLPLLPPVSEIKARYRRGKAWSEVLFAPRSASGSTIIDTLGMSFYTVRRQAIADMMRVLKLYAALEKKKDLDAAYNVYIKSLYTLGRLFENSVYDNAYTPIQKEDGENTTIFNEFLKDPEQVDLTKYRPAKNLDYLEKAENCFQTILNTYEIERYSPIDMKKLARESKYPISPRDLFYRFGTLYAKWFLINAIPEKTRQTQVSKAYMGVYFFFLANEYCLWRKKMNLPTPAFGYITDRLNKLLQAAAIDFYGDEHIKNMLSNFDTVLTKIELPH